MAKLTALPHQDIINGLKGKIDYYLWMGVPVARKWPRSPGKHRSPAVQAQWPAWTVASRLWSDMDGDMQQWYRETAHGSNLSGRDLAQKAYLAGYLKY